MKKLLKQIIREEVRRTLKESEDGAEEKSEWTKDDWQEYGMDHVKDGDFGIFFFEESVSTKDYQKATKESIEILRQACDMDEADFWEMFEKEGRKIGEGRYYPDIEGLEEKGGDNTYNWGFLGPDYNIKTFYDSINDKYYALLEPHLGGDIRGNYGYGFVFEYDSNYPEYLEGFSGSSYLDVEFDDGSDIRLSGESSDVYRWEIYNPSDLTGIAKELYDFWDGNKFRYVTDKDDFWTGMVDKS